VTAGATATTDPARADAIGALLGVPRHADPSSPDATSEVTSSGAERTPDAAAELTPDPAA
jgi:hypothetical protein